MPQPRLFDEPTVRYTFRMSEPQRRLLDYLASREGTEPARYMRQVWEEHLAAQGFPIEQGRTGVRDPQRRTSEGWRRDHTEYGQRAKPKAGAP